MFCQALTQGSKQWKSYKKLSLYISSTEMSSVLRLNKYKTYEVLKKEKENPEEDKDFENGATLHGRAWEPVGLHLFSKMFDPDQEYDWRAPGLDVHTRYPICCSPDRMVFCGGWKTPPKMFGVELKTLYTRKRPETIHKIYDEHLIQCLTCLYVTQAERWFLVYFDPSEMNITFFEIKLNCKMFGSHFNYDVTCFLDNLHKENNLTFHDLESWKEATKIALPLSIRSQKELTNAASYSPDHSQKANPLEEIRTSQK